MTHARHRDRAFLAAVALTFVASAAATISGYLEMSSMPGMEMPGGWTMSMTWMRMPGQSWPGAAAMFLGMWIVMMVAMMLPALAPALARYRDAIGARAGSRLGRLTVIVALAYFTVWTLVGLVAFPVGVAVGELVMNMPALSRAVPVVTGMTLVTAGALQFTAWKSRQLRCCRGAPRHSTDSTRDAWHHGLRLGIYCVRCCAGSTAVLLVLGIMDVRAMAIVTVAITAERASPAGERAARVVGALAIAAGLIQLARI